MRKIEESNWQGAIFAKAGLERINLLPDHYTDLDWMVPAPAQGAMVVVTRENDTFSSEAISRINHRNSEISTYVERDFLRVLEGGCTAPIGAIATIKNNTIHLKGVLFSPNGVTKLEVDKSISLDNYMSLGKQCALEILGNGGKKLMQQIKDEVK